MPSTWDDAKVAPNSGPTCGAALIRIAYGFPGDDMIEQAERGEIELGGCLLGESNPQFHCRGPKPHYWRLDPEGQLVTTGRNLSGWSQAF
jgi:hypothetical protein